MSNSSFKILHKANSLLIGLLLFTQIGCAQRSVNIDNRLEKYTVEFATEAIIRNVDGIDILLELNNIYITNIQTYLSDVYKVELPEVLLGYYDRTNKNILIDESIEGDPIIVRLILFHELGHSAGLQHTCKECIDIMSRLCYSEYKTLLFNDVNLWNKELDKFFNALKE